MNSATDPGARRLFRDLAALLIVIALGAGAAWIVAPNHRLPAHPGELLEDWARPANP